MKCLTCEGKGFKEYDAGLVQIGCKTCGMTGKVDCKLTKEEFEKAYAFKSDMTPDQVVELGLVAVPSDCLVGWAMQKAEIVPYLPEGVEEALSIVDLTHMTTKEEVNKVASEKLGRICPPDKETDDSISGTESDNQPTGSANTSKPQQPKKSKAKRKAKAKSS